MYVPTNVERVSNITPIEFLRDYVSKNIPVIITDIVCKWDAYKKWDIEYLRNTIGNSQVTVSQTPNGRADAPLSLKNNPYPILGIVKYSKRNIFH